MNTVKQTVEIPTNRRFNLDVIVPKEIPAGKATIEYKIIPFPHATAPVNETPAKKIPDWLEGLVSSELFGKGTINGDIIGPFHEEWEKGA